MKDFGKDFSPFEWLRLDEFITYLSRLPIFSWLQVDINRYQVVNRTYARFLIVVLFILPAGGIVSYIERPDLVDIAVLQILVGIASLFLIFLAKRKQYLKFEFCMMLILAIAYCFFKTGGIDGTLLLYLAESLILTWVLLSDNMGKVWLSVLIHFIVFGFLMAMSLWFPNTVNNIYLTREARIISTALHGAIIFFMLCLLMDLLMKFIKELKEIDALTGIYKREHMEQLFDECQQSMSEQKPESIKKFAVALIDIDNFKSINDGNGGGKAGHAIGDKALNYLSTFIASKLRKTDSFGRYGGDELIMILSDVTREEASLILDRIRFEVSQYPFPSLNLNITLSIGVADILPDLPMETVFEEADRRMYMAKKRGKNRVVYMDEKEEVVQGGTVYA